MITQKGLQDSDIIVIIGEDRTHVSFSVGFPDCEKFNISKQYKSVEDYEKNFPADYLEFKDNLATTVFTIEADEDEKDLVVNDSWGSIFNDALGSVKSKLFK